MTPTQEILSKNLKAIRKEKKLYQKDIESLTGILASTYSRIENMEVSPNLASLEKIAQALEVSVADLFQSREIQDQSLIQKLESIENLSEYNKKVVEILMDSILEKDKLEKSQDIKMKKRLDELNTIRN
jgi:transcriptional regulator with XRE-family HTH domain